MRKFHFLSLGPTDDGEKTFSDPIVRSTTSGIDSSTASRSQRIVFSAHYTKPLGVSIFRFKCGDTSCCRTAHNWYSSAESANLWIRRKVFGRTEDHRTLVDWLTRVIVVGPGDHFAQLVYNMDKRSK